MTYKIDISYPVEKMELSRRRYQARLDFKVVDRVPVLFCLERRYFLPVLGMGFNEFLADVETHYYTQLRYEKYRIENIPEDYCLDRSIRAYPYFENVTNAGAFGAKIGWSDTETPRAIPILRDVSDIDQLEVPPPDAGLWGQRAQWWSEMRKLAEETEVTFNGEPGRVEIPCLDIGWEGPHMTAIDLAGENLYWWMIEYPEAYHKLMDKVTEGMAQAARYFRQIDPRPRDAFGLAEDSAQIMSAESFREFVAPYDNRLYAEFGAGLRQGRGMHMCGDSRHLHSALMDDLKITSFDLFGYRVEPKVAVRNMGGRALFWGNVDPMLMLNGTKGEVKAAALRCLDAFSSCGGLLLGDGANVCPGTPIENLAALTEASEEYGAPLG